MLFSSNTRLQICGCGHTVSWCHEGPFVRMLMSSKTRLQICGWSSYQLMSWRCYYEEPLSGCWFHPTPGNGKCGWPHCQVTSRRAKGRCQDAGFIQHRATELWMAALSTDIVKGCCQDADFIQHQATEVWMAALSTDITKGCCQDADFIQHQALGYCTAGTHILMEPLLKNEE